MQIFKSKDGDNGKSGGRGRGQQAKDLLAKYGVAYIGTSVALSLVSITVCYLLINSGVDMPALLEKVGSFSFFLSLLVSGCAAYLYTLYFSVIDLNSIHGCAALL